MRAADRTDTAAHRDFLSLSAKTRISQTRISTNRPPFIRWGIWRFPQSLFGFGNIYTSMRYTPMRCTTIRYTPMRCTPVRYTPHEVYDHEVHARDMHAHEVHACGMHVYEVHAHEMHVCEVHAHGTHARE